MCGFPIWFADLLSLQRYKTQMLNDWIHNFCSFSSYTCQILCKTYFHNLTPSFNILRAYFMEMFLCGNYQGMCVYVCVPMYVFFKLVI
jgi:hypothetical protein